MTPRTEQEFQIFYLINNHIVTVLSFSNCLLLFKWFKMYLQMYLQFFHTFYIKELNSYCNMVNIMFYFYKFFNFIKSIKNKGKVQA